MDSEFCKKRIVYHEGESRQYREDAHATLSGEGSEEYKNRTYDHFMSLALRHEQDAEDWRVKLAGELA